MHPVQKVTLFKTLNSETMFFFKDSIPRKQYPVSRHIPVKANLGGAPPGTASDAEYVINLPLWVTWKITQMLNSLGLVYASKLIQTNLVHIKFVDWTT